MTGDAQQRSACIVRTGGMGDLLLITPVLRALRERFPGIEIDYVVGRPFADTVSGIPYLRRVLPWDKKADFRPGRFLPFVRDLRRARYDLFLNFQPSVKTTLMALGAHAGRTLTYRRIPGNDPATGRQVHAIDNFARTLAPLGVPQTLADKRLDFFVPPTVQIALEARLAAEAGVAPGEPLVVVNPGATHLVNRWPAARIADLFALLAQTVPGVRLALCGGPDDREMAQAILPLLRGGVRVTDFAGRTNIKELGALLARADVVVSGDTGPMHIASAVGTPLVALFGPADPDRTGPVGPRHLIVVNRDGLDCVPCRQRTCARGDNACMVNPVSYTHLTLPTKRIV